MIHQFYVVLKDSFAIFTGNELLSITLEDCFTFLDMALNLGSAESLFLEECQLNQPHLLARIRSKQCPL